MVLCNGLNAPHAGGSLLTSTPRDDIPFQTFMNGLEQINTWMIQNFLQLNKDKQSFGAKEEESQSVMLKSTNQARNLGVIMDSDLNSNSQPTVTWRMFPGLKE